MIYSKGDLNSAIETSFSLFSNFADAQNENDFISTPAAKWSTGQHLEHLIKTTQPVLLAFRMPLPILRLMFGKPNRPERTYDELVEKYKAKLANGAVAPTIFVPKVVSYAQKKEKIQRFLALKEKLKKAAASLPDDKLDRYLLPHPLLGKLTLREMLYFTIYHTEHHLAILKKR